MFIDGCFWHGCPEHYRQPAANAEYWIAKVHRNMKRDAETDESLVGAGWTPLRFWTHHDPEGVAVAIHDAVVARGD